MNLTKSDLCRITGIGATALDRLVAAGLLQPENTGQGTGRHRIYALSDAVAVAVGLRYRNEGAGTDRVAGVVRLLASMPLERLEAHLEKGETFPVPAMLLGDTTRPDCWIEGMMIVPPDVPPAAAKLMKRLDLSAICRDVKTKAAKLHPAKQTGGRSRGLATVK